MTEFNYSYRDVDSKYCIHDQEGHPIVSLTDAALADQLVRHLNSDTVGYSANGDLAFNFKILDPNKKVIGIVEGIPSANKLIRHLNRDFS